MAKYNKSLSKRLQRKEGKTCLLALFPLPAWERMAKKIGRHLINTAIIPTGVEGAAGRPGRVPARAAPAESAGSGLG